MNDAFDIIEAGVWWSWGNMYYDDYCYMCYDEDEEAEDDYCIYCGRVYDR